MKRYLVVSALLSASTIAAQKPCTGPGSSFGVTSYQCASCAIEQKQDQRMGFVFHAEPVILLVSERSALRAGDIVEAVNDQPITTRAGSDAFTYPAGATRITVRREGKRSVISVLPFTSCAADGPTDFSIRGTSIQTRLQPDSAGVRRTDAFGMTMSLDTLATAGADPQAGRFGFALSCTPSCTRVRSSGGQEYWKHDGPPPVAVVTPDGAADRAGVRVGDVVLAVDGLPILEETGALKLLHSERAMQLRLTVRRDGSTSDLTLRTTHRPMEACRDASLIVRNETRSNVDVLWRHGSREGFMPDVPPGRTEHELPDGLVVQRVTITAVDPNIRRGTPERLDLKRVRTQIVCK